MNEGVKGEIRQLSTEKLILVLLMNDDLPGVGIFVVASIVK